MLYPTSRLFRSIAILCCICLIPIPALSETCTEAIVRGENDAASKHTSKSWFYGGVASGVLLGFIGTGILTAMSAGSSPRPKVIPEGYNEACYINGYSGKARKKNMWSSLGGGLVGTAILAVVVITVAD